MTDCLRSRVNRPPKKYTFNSVSLQERVHWLYASASCWKYRYDTQPMLHQPDERLFRFALVFSSHVTTTFSAVQRSLSTGSWHITRKRDPFKIRTKFSLIFVWASGVLQSPSKQYKSIAILASPAWYTSAVIYWKYINKNLVTAS